MANMLSTRCCGLLLAFLFIFLNLFDTESRSPRGVDATTNVVKSDLVKIGKAPPSTDLHKDYSYHPHGRNYVAEKIKCYGRKTMEKVATNIIVIEDEGLKGNFRSVDTSDYGKGPSRKSPKKPVQIETEDRFAHVRV